jgi:hypothetical protein
MDDPDPIDDHDACGGPTVSTISAIVDDPSDVAGVLLYRRFVDDNIPGAWGTQIAPYSNGTGRWETSVDYPGNVHPGTGGRIDWYFQATDNENNTSLNPADAPTSFYSTTVDYCD